MKFVVSVPFSSSDANKRVIRSGNEGSTARRWDFDGVLGRAGGVGSRGDRLSTQLVLGMR